MPFTRAVKRNWLKILIIIAVAATAIYVSIRILGSAGVEERFIPPGFLEARSEGAITAEKIVALSKESITNLAAVSTEDEIGNYTSGLDLVLQEVERNNKAREEALNLSKELETMVTNLNQVQPEEAAKVGLEAIINESQIVQRLINYNSYVFQLLDVLQSRFASGGAVPNTDEKVKELIAKMNEEAEAVNELNDKYKTLMDDFDRLTAN